jgi:signal transduction histidine kinase
LRLKDVDTLFLRIFLLLLVAFMVSSFLAFAMFQATAPRPVWRSAHEVDAPIADLAGAPRAAASAQVLVVGRPHPPWISIGLDAVIKITAGALAAWFAARALSRPMRRLSDAARGLGESLSPAAGVGIAHAPPLLDETHGTREVRETAQVFNGLARQLNADFNTQRLLLATVSHDLRTPLTRLRMRLAELEQHPAAARAIDDVRQMDELIESLLALFRPSAETPSADDQRIDALALVQAVVDDLPSDGPIVNLTGAPASTRCPPAALRRMVENLLENAVRHGGDRNAIDVHVTAGRECVCVSVADRGPGLSVEQLASAGTPFLRWVGVRDEGQRRAGLGLGLYITRALAERERGSLKLAAREGGGLVATLELPLAN